MRLSIREYAAREGISEVTVRRRIKRGELVAERVPTAQGFAYEIVVDDDDEESSADQAADQGGGPEQSSPDHSTSQELITELRSQIDYLKQEIEDRKREHDRDRSDWRGELERLHTLMAQQGQTIQALTQQVEALPERIQHSATTEATSVRHTYLSQVIGSLAPVALVPLGVLIAGTLALVFDVVSQSGWVATAVRIGWIVALASVPFEFFETRRIALEWKDRETYKEQVSSTEYDAWYDGMVRRIRNGAIRSVIAAAVVLIAAIGYTFFDVDLPPFW